MNFKSLHIKKTLNIILCSFVIFSTGLSQVAFPEMNKGKLSSSLLVPNYVWVDASNGFGVINGGIQNFNSTNAATGQIVVDNYMDFWMTIEAQGLNGAQIYPETFWTGSDLINSEGKAIYNFEFTDVNQEIRIYVYPNYSSWLYDTAFTIIELVPGGSGLEETNLATVIDTIKGIDNLENIAFELSSIDSVSSIPGHLGKTFNELWELLTDNTKITIIKNAFEQVGIYFTVQQIKDILVITKIYDQLKKIADTIVYSIIVRTGTPVLIVHPEHYGNPPPIDPLPEPPVDLPHTNDLSTFVTHVSIPEGMVVSSNQALAKTWRVKNTGTTTWDGYKLKFIDGEQMGGSSEIAIPTTASGQTRDITVNLVAPSNLGLHAGSWQIVNSQGGWVSGGKLWVKINVQSQSSVITLTTDPSSPASAGQVNIYARVNNFPNLRALRILIDGQQLCELGAPEIQDCVWHTSGYAAGQHSIVAEADDWTGSSWDKPERKTILFELTGSAVTNHGPYRPTLVQNPAYDWYVTIGNAPQLCAQQQGDPDGNPVIQYRFLASASVGTADSGWVGSSCHTFGSITPGTYEWHAQVKDSLGGISDWSDSWHFTVEPIGVTATINSFSTPSPSNAEEIKIFACSSGHAGINITLRVLVNEANDGSDSGRWNIIKEQGSPCFNDTDAPVWRTLEYADGPHKVRVVAMAIQPDAGNVYDTVYTLNHRRPNSPRLMAPVPVSQNVQEAIYLNSRTVTYKWEPTIRATSYTLHVSTNISPKDDPNPIFRQTFNSSINEHTFTLGQDYPTLYWQVEATNDVGSNASGAQRFGIDRQAPVCTVSNLPATTYANVFQVNWNSTDNLADVKTADIQFMDSERGTWEDWLTSIPFDKTYELFDGQPGHSYFFRCRATDNANNTGNYPTSADTSIIIDPFTRPGTPWWDTAYGQKRDIVVLNNMGSTPLSQGYPIHLHFDNSTTPTAASLYGASLSNPKCNDLRIIYGDAIELDRIVQKCTSSAIDIWFRTQVSLTGGSSDYSSHQLYYGNSNAGSPPADPNQVWYPYKENDTAYLYYFQEGSGSTASDASGNNRNCSINPSVQWSSGKFGNGLTLNRANNGDSQSLTCGSASLSSFTIDFWIKPNSNGDGRLAGQLASGGRLNWLLSDFGGKMRLDVWPCSSCGSSEVRSNFSLRDSQYVGKWNHVAVSFNGGNEVRFYINGSLDSIKNLGQSGLNQNNIPLEIGSVEGIGQINESLGGFRISTGVKTSFPYGNFGNITNEPSAVTGNVVVPPVTGSPDLVILSLSTYPNPEGGVLVEALIENQGDLSTESGFYTDLYLDHLPTGAEDYSNSLRFWINDPIDAGEIVTLTTVILDVSSISSSSAKSVQALNATGSFSESSGALYAQTDSAGLVQEPDNQNNIYETGVQVCTATPDTFEDDDTYTISNLISIGDFQTHNFDIPGDQDWIKFVAQAGKTYRITTSNLGISSDTYLYLYGTNGSTLITSNDDFNDTLASQIEWIAPQNGTYYILVKHWNPNVGGCGTGYDLGLSEVIIDTPTPTSTATFTPSHTPTRTPTATSTPTFTKTHTLTNTATYTPTRTATATKTATSTSTATSTYTPTKTLTSTATHIPTGSATKTFTATSTYTSTITPTITPTPTQQQIDIFEPQGIYDGWILESSETSNKGGTLNTTATLLYVGDNAQNKQYRSSLSFDTSSLPEDAVITNIQLKIKVQGFAGNNVFTPTKTHGNLLMDIRNLYFGMSAELVASDFQAGASKNSVGVLASVPAVGWYTVTLKDTSYPFINLTGTTQFRLRFQKDDNDDLGADYLKIYSGNAGAANRPKLIIEYYMP